MCLQWGGYGKASSCIPVQNVHQFLLLHRTCERGREGRRRRRGGGGGGGEEEERGGGREGGRRGGEESQERRMGKEGESEKLKLK